MHLFKKKKKKTTGLLRSSGLFPGTHVATVLGGALAALSSSSLSEPPEELLSEAAGGTLLFAFMAASVGENPAIYKNVEHLFLQVSADLTLTAQTVVLFGLLIRVAVSRVHWRTAPGPGLCTGMVENTLNMVWNSLLPAEI